MDKLHVYTMTHNEEYMIKYFLRYYETIADKIFVIDDMSTDKTIDIIKTCPKATILPYPYPSGLDAIDKNNCLENVYKEHSRGKAEWVMILDSDEFVYHPNLRDLLDVQRAKGTRALVTCGLFLASKEIPNTDKQLFEAMPYSWRKKTWDKEIVFDPELDVKFVLGCHPPTKFSDGVKAKYAKLMMYHCCFLSRQWIIDHYNIRISRMRDSDYKRHFVKNIHKYVRIALQNYENTIKS